MSNLLNTYTNLKKENSSILYLFKVGAFYISLEDDARFLSEKFNLKIVNLNSETIKCGFPCSSFDKYYLLFQKLNIEFRIVDKNTIFEASIYLQNHEISNLINIIKEIDINSLSVSEAFAFIENLKTIANKIV